MIIQTGRITPMGKVVNETYINIQLKELGHKDLEHINITDMNQCQTIRITTKGAVERLIKQLTLLKEEMIDEN